MPKCESPEEIMICHEINGEELELTVYFEIRNAEEIITPICATCGNSLEPWLLMEIGEVVKVVDTTDTTNQSAGEEKIFPKEHPCFSDVVRDAIVTFRQQQECPDIDFGDCVMRSNKSVEDIFDSEGHIRQ